MKKKDAKRIAAMVIAIMDELNICGSMAFVNTNNVTVYKKLYGNARPMTLAIAVNKGAESAYTGARTGALAKQIKDGKRTRELYGIPKKTFVPFHGGCPIYTKAGVLIGGAGFSEQTGITDERIIAAAIENCGFLSDTPVMKDIPHKKILKAAKKASKNLAKK